LAFFKEASLFHLARRYGVHDGQDMLAFETRITFDVLGEIPARTGIAIIVYGNVIENFPLS
jgi:hypothetical protein